MSIGCGITACLIQPYSQSLKWQLKLILFHFYSLTLAARWQHCRHANLKVPCNKLLLLCLFLHPFVGVDAAQSSNFLNLVFFTLSGKDKEHKVSECSGWGNNSWRYLTLFSSEFGDTGSRAGSSKPQCTFNYSTVLLTKLVRILGQILQCTIIYQ